MEIYCESGGSATSFGTWVLQIIPQDLQSWTEWKCCLAEDTDPKDSFCKDYFGDSAQAKEFPWKIQS